MFRSDTPDHKAHVFTGMSAKTDDQTAAKTKEIEIAGQPENASAVAYSQNRPHTAYVSPVPHTSPQCSSQDFRLLYTV